MRREMMDLESLFNPKSIAVIGASGKRGSVGYIYLESIVKGGFQGEVHPINPKYDEILGLRCHDSIESLGKVDLAVIATNKSLALGLLEDCVEVGVRAAIIPTGGFEEVGEKGAELERQVRRIADEGEVALLGTNTLGMINNHIDLQINFNPRSLPPKGDVSIISQSGGMGLSIISKLREEGVGMSKWIGVGNRTQLDFSEFLRYLADDETTGVIGIFMEGTDRAREFCDIALKVVPDKPVVVYKMGKSGAVDFLAVTHTGTGVGKTGSYRGAFRQHGVMIADSTRDMVAKLKALDLVQEVRGNRLGMFTYTAGPSIATADLLEDYDLPKPDEGTLDRIRGLMKGEPPTILKNPLDVDGQGYTPEGYLRLLEAFASDTNFDLLATVSTAGLLYPAEQLLSVALSSKRPILHCHVADAIEIAGEDRERLQGAGIPVYTTPEELASGLMALQQRRVMLSELRGRGEPGPTILIDPDTEDGILDEHESKRVLSASGLPTVEERVVSDMVELVNASEELGYPLVLKVLSREITHKSDIGAVRVGIQDGMMLESTYSSFRERWPGCTLLVQRMVPPGVELIIGRIRDPAFGDVVTLGVGGFLADLFPPVVRVCPCTLRDCLSALEELRPREILDGYRGMEPVDREAVASIMERVSRIELKGSGIEEMDLNPLIVRGGTIEIVDALIRTSKG